MKLLLGYHVIGHTRATSRSTPCRQSSSEHRSFLPPSSPSGRCRHPMPQPPGCPHLPDYPAATKKRRSRHPLTPSRLPDVGNIAAIVQSAKQNTTTLSTKAALQKEREATQALLEEKEREAEERTARLMEEKEREAEERTARLMEEERARNDASTRAMYELIVSMCEKVGQAPPPMPAVVTTPAMNNSRTASHHLGPGGSAPGVTGPMNPDASPPC